MFEELRKVIEANLPAATAGAMKEYLKTAEETAKKLEKCEGEKEALEVEGAELRARLNECSELVAQHGDLQRREAEVAERETKIGNRILQIQLEEANKRVDVLTNLTETVFKNRKLVIEKSGNVPMAIKDSEYINTVLANESITSEEV